MNSIAVLFIVTLYLNPYNFRPVTLFSQQILSLEYIPCKSSKGIFVIFLAEKGPVRVSKVIKVKCVDKAFQLTVLSSEGYTVLYAQRKFPQYRSPGNYLCRQCNLQVLWELFMKTQITHTAKHINQPYLMLSALTWTKSCRPLLKKNVLSALICLFQSLELTITNLCVVKLCEQSQLCWRMS